MARRTKYDRKSSMHLNSNMGVVQMRSRAALRSVLMVVMVSIAGADTLVGVYVDGKKQDFAPAALE